uniref:Uncharacterized protein n=1 Tax=Romanomermis culicivorax TaxID=13658 RepID=A0A915IQL1_ROMCU
MEFIGLNSDTCPNNIICEGPCCVTQKNEYYCCDFGNNPNDRLYVVGVHSFWKDYWGVFVGCLIASILISIILSVICCLFCNGCCWCWPTRIGRDSRGGFAASAFPIGAVLYSPYPHGMTYDQSASNSTNDRPQRVHFSEEKA